jgi:DNA-binding transcriptional regulator YhcF (GntR family)
MSDPRKPKESFSARYVSHIATLDPPIGPAPRVLLRIYDYHTREAESCWPGRERLAKLLQCSPATVTRANAELEEAGYISRSRRMGSSSLTYLEQINASPNLQEFARHILSGKAAEEYDWQNKRSSSQKCDDVVANIEHSSSQKCDIETSLRETHLNNKLSTPSASTCSSGNT